MRSPLDDELRREARIADAAEDIRRALDGVPSDVQRQALIRVLASVSKYVDSEEEVADDVHESAEPTSESDVADNGATIQDRVYAELLSHPRMPIREIARCVYGEDNDRTRANVRSLLNVMKGKGRVRMIVPGTWEAIGTANPTHL